MCSFSTICYMWHGFDVEALLKYLFILQILLAVCTKISTSSIYAVSTDYIVGKFNAPLPNAGIWQFQNMVHTRKKCIYKYLQKISSFIKTTTNIITIWLRLFKKLKTYIELFLSYYYFLKVYIHNINILTDRLNIFHNLKLLFSCPLPK